MAISAYTGLPGAGKSYGVVEHVILPAIRDGRRVVTNIPMTDAFRQDFPGAALEVCGPDDWERPEWWDGLAGAVVVLDELWRLWPSGLKTAHIPEHQKAFLAEHRHKVDAEGRSTQVVFVTQDLADIASFPRNKVEQTFRAVKLVDVGQRNRYRVDAYTGPVTGPEPPIGKRNNQTFGTYKPAVYRYYQSATQSSTGAVGDENPMDRRGSIFRNRWWVLGLAFGALGIVWGVSHAVSLFSGGLVGENRVAAAPAEEQAPEPAPQTVSFAPAEGAPAPSPEPTAPPISKQWRLAGFVTSEDGQRKEWAILKGRAGAIRRVDAPDCEDTGNLHTTVCLVEGERVAAWTGPQHQYRLGAVRTDTEGRHVP